MKPLDYSLYNRVKAKFPPVPLTMIFVSLAPENLERLEGQIFTFETREALWSLAKTHYSFSIPHAVIGGFEPGEAAFEFSCHEFECEEDLNTNKFVAFSFETYHNRPVDREAVKRDLQKLESGAILVGNA